MHKGSLYFPSFHGMILSDYRREVIKQFSLELYDFSGLKGYTVAKRSIFVLDEQDIVRHVWVSEDPSIEKKYGENTEDSRANSIENK